MAKKRAKILETKNFGLFIGIFIFIIFALLLWAAEFNLLTSLELKMLDIHFNFKNVRSTSQVTKEGVTEEYRNPEISPDLLIVGIDFRTLSTFGRWPFPRYRHADLMNSFARIRNQEERERALFLDVFFIEPDEKEPYNDVLLISAIEENGRVFLETVLDETPPSSDIAQDYFRRQELLYETYGKITNIEGDWKNMRYFLGLQPPLQPYSRATHGYGHANFLADTDKIYRKHALVAKSSVLLEEFRLEELTSETPVNDENFERLAWFDRDGRMHNIEYPHTPEVIEHVSKEIAAKAPPRSVDTDDDGTPDDSYYVIRKY